MRVNRIASINGTSIWLVLPLILCSLNLWSQNKPNAVIPPSPTAASLGKYGDIPVSNFADSYFFGQKNKERFDAQSDIFYLPFRQVLYKAKNASYELGILMSHITEYSMKTITIKLVKNFLFSQSKWSFPRKL